MPNQSIVRPVSQRRREKQKGLEAIEFGLWVLLMMPAFVWMFISGMNFIRYIKASDVTRSAAMLYTKGMDMSDIGMHQVLARVSNGLNLVVTTSGATGSATGNGLIILTRVQYIGTCTCSNANKYVMTQRLYIGNRGLQISGSGVESFAGPAPSSSWSSSTGGVTNYTTNGSAVVSSAFTTLWGTSLSDGQYVYVIESYFKPITTMGSGAFDVSGVYNRIFM